MANTQEMFRFVAVRRPARAVASRIASRLVRDRRTAGRGSMLVTLYGRGAFEEKLVAADAFAASADFVSTDDPEMAALEPIIAFFRDALAPGVALADLAARLRAEFPDLAALLQRAPPAALLDRANAAMARLWDSLYAQTIRGCDRYVSTNSLVDGLRAYHVLRLLWLSAKLDLATWAGGGFDDYHTLIDVEAALAATGDDAPGEGPPPGGIPPSHPSPVPASTLAQVRLLRSLDERIARIDEADRVVGTMVAAGAVVAPTGEAPGAARLDAKAAAVLAASPELAGVDLDSTPVGEVRRRLRLDRELVSMRRQMALAGLADPRLSDERFALELLSVEQRPPAAVPASALSGLASAGSSFRVPLAVGVIKPPTVGDLLIVEQTLRRYELGELADIETIMRGERRERTIRKLARTSQTTTTESSFEQEESSSTKTDERFQLSSQAQQTAEQSFGVQAGVSVTGKFGPVQVSASVNASFDTSKSSSDSTAQEYAKTVTEEASKRVRNSIKESSSITVLTETQDTSLRGFNNEKGTAHVNGLYRWVDKVYDAQVVNYGRRLMLSLNVPEPAAAYRALVLQEAAEATSGLVEPLHPSRIGRGSLAPLPPADTDGGFRSHQDLDEANYARLAGLYDASVQPPPPEHLTGSKAFVYPEGAAAAALDPHDQVNDLSQVTGDNTLTLDPAYRLTAVAVLAPVGATGELGSYVNALKLAEVAKPSAPSDGTTVAEANLLLVQVADKSFFLSARRDPDDADKKIVSTNFNVFQTVDQTSMAFGETVRPAIPVTITANFEGIYALTVAYKAYRLDEAYEAWKASTFATILKAYDAKKREHEQARAAAEAEALSATEAMTRQLRDDQYRGIELTELKRGCIDLLSAGTAAGFTSIAVARDGTPRIVHDPAEGALYADWRTPLANGSVAEFFELAFEWENTTYQFHPYYWAGARRWPELARIGSADPVFEQFLRAGNASVVVPVRPGFERPVVFFLKTGLVWGGGYLSLFTSADMLAAYADVELGRQFDPPLPLGAPWEIRVPTSLVMLQQGEVLPEFPPADTAEATASVSEPVPDGSTPF